MIDPKSVLIATPSHSGTVECGYAGGLAEVFASGFAGSISFLMGNADVGAARCHVTHAFLRSKFEWLVMIDADIQFSGKDFGILMQVEPDAVFMGSPEVVEYSRLKRPDDRVLWSPELLVCAEYSRKTEAREPVRFGLGFTRIHRSVFKILDELTTPEGVETVDQFMHQGELVREYFPMTTLGDGRRVGEDGGFYTLCRIAGVVPRIEQRTRLVHWGKAAYPYITPVMGSAQ